MMNSTLTLSMKRTLFLCVLFTILCAPRCSDPLSEQEKDVTVKTLFNGPLVEGRYVFFWDGTDDGNKFVSGGTYYARLYSRDFTFQITLTAQEGGTGALNDSSLSDPRYQPLPQLDQNTPNPFKIKDGTNIPFSIDGDYSIRLTIRDKE